MWLVCLSSQRKGKGEKNKRTSLSCYCCRLHFVELFGSCADWKLRFLVYFIYFFHWNNSELIWICSIIPVLKYTAAWDASLRGEDCICVLQKCIFLSDECVFVFAIQRFSVPQKLQKIQKHNKWEWQAWLWATNLHLEFRTLAFRRKT